MRLAVSLDLRGHFGETDSPLPLPIFASCPMCLMGGARSFAGREVAVANPKIHGPAMICIHRSSFISCAVIDEQPQRTTT